MLPASCSLLCLCIALRKTCKPGVRRHDGHGGSLMPSPAVIGPPVSLHGLCICPADRYCCCGTTVLYPAGRGRGSSGRLVEGWWKVGRLEGRWSARHGARQRSPGKGPREDRTTVLRCTARRFPSSCSCVVHQVAGEGSGCKIDDGLSIRRVQLSCAALVETGI
jgi:hypothetical protein